MKSRTIFVGLLVTSFLPSFAFADGYLNDAATTQRLGGVGNYLFHTTGEDQAVREALKEIENGGANFLDIVSFSQSSDAETSSLKSREVYFSPGSTNLSATAEVTLDSVAEELKSNSELRVELAGFADRDDSSQIKTALKLSNEEISSARAKIVMEALFKKGVPVSQIFWTGKGVAVSENRKESERAENRRVEIRFQ